MAKKKIMRKLAHQNKNIKLRSPNLQFDCILMLTLFASLYITMAFKMAYGHSGPQTQKY